MDDSIKRISNQFRTQYLNWSNGRFKFKLIIQDWILAGPHWPPRPPSSASKARRLVGLGPARPVGPACPSAQSARRPSVPVDPSRRAPGLEYPSPGSALVLGHCRTLTLEQPRSSSTPPHAPRPPHLRTPPTRPRTAHRACRAAPPPAALRPKGGGVSEGPRGRSLGGCSRARAQPLAERVPRSWGLLASMHQPSPPSLRRETEWPSCHPPC